MIDYREAWLLPLVFKLQGSVYARCAIFAVPSSLLTIILVMTEAWVPGYREETMLAALDSSAIWAMLTAVLIFMVSFRTRQGYSRFWEGTGLLHQMKGEWFDTVSNCVTFTISANKERVKEVEQFRHTIVRLMSLCHGCALEEISGTSGMMDVIDATGLDADTLRHLKECVEVRRFNRVEVILHMLQNLITDAQERKITLIAPPILSRVFQTISRGYVHLLTTKKITDTKFPFPYVQLIVTLLLLHSIITPLVVSSCVRSLVLAPVLCFIPLFGAHALNFTAMELEDPFGEDANDLPLAHFQIEMNKCLLMLLHPHTDLIPSVSSHCMLDFDELYHTVQICHTARRETLQRHTTSALFDRDLVARPSTSSDDASVKASDLSTLSWWGGTRSIASEGIVEPPMRAGGAAADGRTAGAAVAASQSDAAADGPADVQEAAGQRSVPPKPPVAPAEFREGMLAAVGCPNLVDPGLRKDGEFELVLVRSIGEMNQSLQQWTQSIEAQVNTLTARLQAVAEFRAPAVPRQVVGAAVAGGGTPGRDGGAEVAFWGAADAADAKISCL